MLRATTACTFSTSQLPKAVRHWGVLHILTSKCASRHNGVHFFDIQKSSDTEVFCTFWLPNVLRATTACTFSTSQLPKSGPKNGVLRTFWLGNVLRATAACTFSTSQLLKVAPTAEVFCTFSLGNVLRAYNGVHFFISHLASWLRTRRFSEPTFRPSWATHHWKNTVFRDLFAHLHLLASYIFFLLTLLSSNLSLLCCLFPALLFISVGSLTSKLPSIIYVYIQAVTQYSGQGTRTKTWHKVQEKGKWRTVMQYCLSLSRKKKPPQNSERSPTSTVPALYRNSLYKKIRGWICFPRRCVVACIWKWKSNKWGTLASSSLRNLDVCE